MVLRIIEINWVNLHILGKYFGSGMWNKWHVKYSYYMNMMNYHLCYIFINIFQIQYPVQMIGIPFISIYKYIFRYIYYNCKPKLNCWKNVYKIYY